MIEPYEFCPKCNGIRKMSISIALQTRHGPDKTIEEVLVLNYHCDTCQTFVCQQPFVHGNRTGLFADQRASIIH